METVTQKLTPAQLHLIKMFSQIKKQKDLKELKTLLFEYFQKKVDEEMDKVWEKKNLSNEKMDKILKTHKRKLY